MKIFIAYFFLSFFFIPQSDNIGQVLDQCSLVDFVGTWKGKVVYGSDELSQGPWAFSIAEDGKSIDLKDETGKIVNLEVDGCKAIHIIKEEGILMTTDYIFENGSLKILSNAEITGPNGEVQKIEMTGSMSKVE